MFPPAPISENTTDDNGQTLQTHAEAKQEVIEELAGWISKGLDKFFNSFLEWQVDVSLFDDWTDKTAQIIQKYNVNMSAFEIFMKYRLEIAFVWSTLVLGKALVSGFKAKKALNNSENQPEVIEDATTA